MMTDTEALKLAIDAAAEERERLDSTALFGWLPISTAPKDGTLIDLCCESVEGEEIYQIRLTDVAWHESNHILPHTGWARMTDDAEMDLVDSPPTCPLGLPRWTPKYWRPLPSLPNAQADS